jgi:hypothetical protein
MEKDKLDQPPEAMATIVADARSIAANHKVRSTIQSEQPHSDRAALAFARRPRAAPSGKLNKKLVVSHVFGILEAGLSAASWPQG